MAFNKKTWKDRVSEQPQRRLLTPTSGGNSYTVDVTRQEGLVVQEGDAFSAANMNDLENRIKTSMDSNEATINTVNNKANTNASNIATLQSNVNTLNNSKAPNNHASTAETYGKGSPNAFGHLKISDNYTSSAGDASMGVAASSKAVSDLHNSTAPKNHASSSDIYGKGTGTEYGHVKLTDSYNAADAIAASGVGASGKAVRDLYHKHANEITVLDNSKAPVNHAVNANTYGLGTQAQYGHVKLSDATDAINNTADLGLGASGKAVASVMNYAQTGIGLHERELSVGDQRFYFDVQNGKYGYNTSPNRGADTFHPFSAGRCGEKVTGAISGSHSGNYSFEICFVSENRICLLSTTPVASANFQTAIGYSWSVTFAAGVLTGRAITAPNVHIPTMSQLTSLCANFIRSSNYWVNGNDWSGGGFGWTSFANGVLLGDSDQSVSQGVYLFVDVTI